MMNEKKFLYVSDEKVKNMLEKSGYKLFQEKNGVWIFLNKETSGEVSDNFNLQNKIAFSNTLTF